MGKILIFTSDFTWDVSLASDFISENSWKNLIFTSDFTWDVSPASDRPYEK